MELFSAHCLNGKWLLQEDVHKQIVLDSLAFMVQHQRIWLYGFVILPNEFHLLWQKQPAWEQKNIRQMLLKFTAHQIKYRLRAVNRRELEAYRSQLRDRQFQFWERAADAVPVPDEAAAREKLHYMHEAPVSAGLCGKAADYLFSSAAFYEKEITGIPGAALPGGPACKEGQPAAPATGCEETAPPHETPATPREGPKGTKPGLLPPKAVFRQDLEGIRDLYLPPVAAPIPQQFPALLTHYGQHFAG